MLPNYRQNDRYRSPIVKHDSFGGLTKSLISCLSEHQGLKKFDGDCDGDDNDDSLFAILGTMRIDTRRLLNQEFSTRINLSKPIRLGYYSVSYDFYHNLDFVQDASALRYLRCPKNGQVNINLILDCNTTIPCRQSDGDGRRNDSRGGHSESPKKMHFLEWIAANKKDLMTDTNQSDDDALDATKDNFADFVCDSFLLKSIMSTPYISSEDAWTIVAVKIRGVIYMVELKTGGQSGNLVTRNSNNNPNHIAATSYAGMKFKEMITVRFDGSHSPVNSKGNRDSFWMVCKTNVGLQHRILYNTRTDCALDDKQLVKTIDEASFVDIRTRPSSINQNQWERRAMAWWITSILSGSKLIFCGERDNDFFARKVTKLYADSLPNPRYKWSPKTCVDFLDKTLTFIKSMVIDEFTPYRFANIEDQIVCSKSDETVEKFIATWYIEHSMYHDFLPFSQQQEESQHTNSNIRSDQEIEAKPETESFSRT